MNKKVVVVDFYFVHLTLISDEEECHVDYFVKNSILILMDEYKTL
jgi:hypothetical protein